MAAPEMRYEIRSGGQIVEYVVTNDAAQQIFVSDAVIRQHPRQQGADLHIESIAGRHEVDPAIPGKQITVRTTVAGGEKMVMYLLRESSN